MIRKEGYIDLDKMLNEKGIDTTSIETITQSSLVQIATNSNKMLIIELNNELYYFKCNKFFLPYNELIVNELARDFKIPAVEYDLAVLNGKKGVLSKNFRKKDVTYITGEELLETLDYDVFGGANNLEAIWESLEYRYQKYTNRREIIEKLMNGIVNMFVFDIIICQTDRHALNWEIEEDKNNIGIVPIYDNEHILKSYNTLNMDISLLVDCDSRSLSENLQIFKNVSSEEYGNNIKDKIWIISEENLNNVFKRIENKTEWPMPEDVKEYYLQEYKKHKNLLDSILDNENIRKR